MVAGLIASSVLSPLGAITFTLPILLFLSFVVRNAYFLIFELRWGGVTPGKRMAGAARDRPARRSITAPALWSLAISRGKPRSFPSNYCW